VETGLPAVRTLAAAAFVLLLCTAAFAAPASAGVELVWSAPPGCPREAAVRAEVERLVGRGARAGAEAPVHAAALVTYDQRRWRATIAITGADASPRQREIEGETCAQVADAAAVIVALAIDPAAGSSLAAPPKPVASPPSPPLSPPPASPPLLVPQPPVQLTPLGPSAPLSPVPPSPAPQSRPMSKRLALGIKAVGGVDIQSLSKPWLGVGLGGILGFSQNRIEIAMFGWLPEVVNMPRKPYVGAQISLFVGSARYCRTIVSGTLGLAGCGGMELGSIHAASFGVSSRSAGSAFWLAPGLGLVGLLSSSRHLALSFELAGVAPSFRRSFWITGLGEVYRPPELTVRAVMGAEVYFQ
jgi:hypothetical protein